MSEELAVTSHGSAYAPSLITDDIVEIGCDTPGLGALVGASDPMRVLFERIARIAPTLANVLVTGESGTGKELVAQTMHSLSGRSKEPFVAVNCGAIPATLVEAELFGQERGSFTGAIRS